jgi:hypothetical protein
MTTIANSNAALTILSQTSVAALKTDESAVDKIMSIVHGTSQNNDANPSQPREVGGTVSSEISKAQMGAMSAVGAATVNGLSYDDPLIAFTPIQASTGNAQAFVGKLARALMDYNAQFDLVKVPAREEYLAQKDVWLASQTATGVNEKQIRIGLELNFGEGGYERHVERINVRNDMTLSRAKVESGIANLTILLKQVFGTDVSISKDQDGRLTLGALDISYDNGQKQLSYSTDGILSTFNRDGSLIRSLSGKEFRDV